MSRIVLFAILVLVFFANTSMMFRVSNQEVELETILERYNNMDYEYVVNLYRANKIGTDLAQLAYVVSVSLFKLSNYYDVLSFTNVRTGFEVLDNTIGLLCAFSLSELGKFEESQKLLRSYSGKLYLGYYDDLVLYYQFRNSLFLEDMQGLVSLNFPSNLPIKEEEVKQILKLISHNSTNQGLVLALLKVLQPKMLKGELLDSVRSNLGFINPSVEIAKQLIRLGLSREGYNILFALSKSKIEKLYYQSMLLYLDKRVKEALDVIKELKKFYTNATNFTVVSLDDVEILELNCLSEVLDKERYNDVVLRKLGKNSKRVLEHILSRYSLLFPDVHFAVIKNFLRRTNFSNSDYRYVRNFVSYHLNEGNFELVRRFSEWALGIVKGTDWEREFLAISYKFCDSRDRKKDIVLRLVKFYPLTYEYYGVLEDLKSDEVLFNTVTNELFDLYLGIKGVTNFSLERVNSFVGISLALKILGVTNTLGDIQLFLKKISFSFDSEIGTNRLPSYLDEMYKYGLILDVYLELGKLTPKPNVRYMNFYQKFKAFGMMCRAVESYGFANNVYFMRGVFFLHFRDYLYPLPYYDLVSLNCSKYDVSLSLAYAIMRSESRYSPFVLSVANAVGLMQLIQPTASSVARRFLGFTRDLSILDIYVIDRNIELGVAHIRELIDFFRNYPDNLREILVVSSYNAGSTAVLKWYRNLKTSDPLIFVEGIRYFETYNYTKGVIENRRFYDIFVLSLGGNLAYKDE